MNRQLSDTILMIRPIAFRRNEETAANNFYQQDIDGVGKTELQENALREFDGFVEKLRANDIDVIVVNDRQEPGTPDSIFPNNWISLHDDGSVMLFPMFAENRRSERRQDIIEILRNNFIIDKVESLAAWEAREKYLEGTGSLILDRVNRLAYAAISDRTHPELVQEFCEQKNFKPVIFHAYQTVGQERLHIYHTNVMMCVGEEFALICAKSIDDDSEREIVISTLKDTGKEVIEIDEIQNNSFAGNMLQVMNKHGKRLVVMSEAAFKSLDSDQSSRLAKHGEIINSNIDTIETLGGGSARCMMAEVFLPRK